MTAWLRQEELTARREATRALALLRGGPGLGHDRLLPLDDVLLVDALRAFLAAEDGQLGGRMARGYQRT